MKFVARIALGLAGAASLAIAAAAGYDGPYTLVYDGPDDNEWAGIATEAAFIRNQLQPAATRLTA